MSNILMIHGAWGGAWVYDGLIEQLSARGHKVRAIDLPGHGRNPAPIEKITMDAYVQSVIDELNGFDGRVVLVGHSLAGSVISQVAEVIPDKIDRLVYVCAFLPRAGDTPIGLMQSDEGGELFQKIVFSEDQTYATVNESEVREIFLHDVKERDRVDQLTPRFAIRQATAPFMAEASLTDEVFGSVPKFYVRCTLDKVMSVALQDRMISGWAVERVISLESGHFPLMSIPDRIVEAIAETVGAEIADG